MKLLTYITTAALFFLSTPTLADQSAKFFLVLQTSDTDLNGRTLSAGHEGAGIEGLLVSAPLSSANPEYSTYQFNYTASQPNDGLLVWTLAGGTFIESEAMGLHVDPSTNVGIALFEPGYEYTYVSFNDDDLMYLKSYYNDTVTPPVDGVVLDLYRWQVCEYNFEGYVYDVLCWVYGEAAPQNPSCKPVSVKRVFSQ